MRRGGLAGLAAATLALAPGVATAMTLDEALALARRGNPDLAQALARSDAADARLRAAEAARLPTVTLSGEAGVGTTDFGGFFGFGRSDMRPRAASVELRQPLFAGGAVSAGIDGARAGKAAAAAQADSARGLLAVRVAEAYVGVLTARRFEALGQAYVHQTEEAVRQARLRFDGGAAPRTELAQAEARLGEARAALARAQGDVALRQAHFVAVVGAESDPMSPAAEPAGLPPRLDDAIAQAERDNPDLEAAERTVDAAEAQRRIAESARLPTVALSANASTMRDRFFPGYHADDVTVAVQGRWVVFSGAVSGQIAEAGANVRAARAARDAARAAVRELVIGAWSELAAARSMAAAAADQARAADIAVESVGHEVRVGEKPAIDLLDAEREQIAAQAALASAQGAIVTAAYRLKAAVGAP